MSIHKHIIDMHAVYTAYEQIFSKYIVNNLWPSEDLLSKGQQLSNSYFEDIHDALNVVRQHLFTHRLCIAETLTFSNLHECKFNDTQLSAIRQDYYSTKYEPASLMHTWSIIHNLYLLEELHESNCTTTNNDRTNFINEAAAIFNKKHTDYGMTWSIMRPITLCDQMLIKIKRLVQLQTPGYIQKVNNVGDDQRSEFIGIMNYSFMLHYQMHKIKLHPIDAYSEYIKSCAELQAVKDSDYGTAWKDLAIESITDLIYAKLLRLKNAKHELSDASENISSNILDVYNYCTFALWHMSQTPINSNNLTK